MRRALSLAALAAVSAGCGSKAVPPVVTGADASLIQAALPPVLLASKAGSQRGDVRSTCDVGPCTDASTYLPARLTVVRRGEAVAFSVPGASSMRARCSGRLDVCFSAVDVLPYGCDKSIPVESVRFSRASTTWRVSIPDGTYELIGRIYFTDDGGHGHGQLVSLGLRVGGGTPAIVAAPRQAAETCP